MTCPRRWRWCALFSLVLLGLGVRSRPFSRTQTRRSSFRFLLFAVFVLSGASSTLEQLPQVIATFAELFPA